MKYFTLNDENKISEICFSLVRDAGEEVPSNKVIQKLENCFKYINTLIDIQKEYSFISLISRKNSDENRRRASEKLLSKYIDKGLISDVSILNSRESKGLGIFARQAIEKHRLMMTVPISDMITEHRAYASPFGEFLRSNRVTKSMPNMSLALHLLNERFSDRSEHSDYIESLPIDVDNFLYLQLADLRLMQHSQYFSEIVNQLCSFFCHYCYFFRILTQLQSLKSCWFKKVFCFEDFRWAVAITMSRNNSIPSPDGKSKMLALIPMWDMMNHKSGEITSDFDDEKQSLIFYAMSSYGPDDEICMDYGDRTSFHYFMYSGFIPEFNKYDTYRLKIGFNKQDVAYKVKQAILSKLSINCDSSFTIDYLNSDIINQSILLYLAIMLIKDSKIVENFLISLKLKEDVLIYAESIKNDLKEFLKTRIKININCIGKSIEKINAQDSVETRPITTDLLRYEKNVLEKIVEKLD